jgi:hypothetical protein
MVCAACHGQNGEGGPIGSAARRSEWVTGPVSNLIRIQLRGLTGPITVPARNTTSRRHGPLAYQTDEQIAAVLTYVRNSFGNKASAVKPEQVASAAQRGRQTACSPEPTCPALIFPISHLHIDVSHHFHHPRPGRAAARGIDRSLRHPVMFFLTSGAAWLAVSILLGVIASAKVHSPGFLDGFSWLTYGRVFPAHINALVYGWGMQAAFAVIIWLMARLSRKECTMPAPSSPPATSGTSASASVWSASCRHGTGMPWMEFPSFAWPVLLVSYFAIVIGRSSSSVSARPAMCIHLPVVSARRDALVPVDLCHRQHPAPLRARPSRDGRGHQRLVPLAMIFLFFTPVALGTRLLSRTESHGPSGLQLFAGQARFLVAGRHRPWAGMQKLAGAPIPVFPALSRSRRHRAVVHSGLRRGVNTLRTMLSCRKPWPAPRCASPSPASRPGRAGVAAVFLNLPGSSCRSPSSRFPDTALTSSPSTDSSAS